MKRTNISNRIDLTSWCTHFIHPHEDSHQRIVNDYTVGNQTYKKGIPDRFSFQNSDKQPWGSPIYVSDGITKLFANEEQPKSAFEILKRILRSGYIKCGWSFRRSSEMEEGTLDMRKLGTSIYGPMPAVCFTEMPLYALIDHAKNHKYAGAYGIAIETVDLYEHGARPAIYGLEKNDLAWEGDPYYMPHSMNLAEHCGIGLSNQYRYVATNLKDGPDWTFEREWRWADLKGNFLSDEIPGLPLTIRGLAYGKLVLIVKTREERCELLELVRRLHEMDITSPNNPGYSKKTLSNIRVLVLDEVKSEYPRLDDIDIDKLQGINSSKQF